jgi:hypothetical protein
MIFNMTPEEKAKRYNETLEMAKIAHKDEDSHLKAVLERIFPELKENNDEKIRKCVKYAIDKLFLKEKIVCDVHKDDVIAWLEKQGEQKLDGTFVNVDDVREDFVNEVYRVLDADSTNDRANQIIDAFDNLPTVTIKQDPCEHCKMTYSTCYSFPCDEKKAFEQGKTALEAINEEKVDNANKVEPKFKAGDWIVRELDNSVHQVKAVIENISNGKYGYDLTKGGYISSQDANFYHLWTIEDAKAGDILYTPKGLGVEGIFLVSGWQQIEGTGKTLCSNIGYRVDDDEIVEGGLGAIWWDGVVDPFYPANKEQRELLFHKMKEAGYTFDFEKKELKKIRMK